jgi:hypothetical protein
MDRNGLPARRLYQCGQGAVAGRVESPDWETAFAGMGQEHFVRIFDQTVDWMSDYENRKQEVNRRWRAQDE